MRGKRDTVLPNISEDHMTKQQAMSDREKEMSIFFIWWKEWGSNRAFLSVCGNIHNSQLSVVSQCTGCCDTNTHLDLHEMGLDLL